MSVKATCTIFVFLTLAAGCTSAFAVSLGNIMPLGDSITYGVSAPGGYRTRLYDRLKDAGYSFSFVGSATDNPSDSLATASQIHHEGHNAIRIDQIEANLNGNTNYDSGNGGYWLKGITGVRAPVYPNIVLLMAGTNDICQSVTAATAIQRLDSLVGRIVQDQPDARVIVASLTPMTGNAAAVADEYNALIPGVVAKYGNAYFLDMHGKLTLEDINPDGIHPKQSGYDKMGDAWFGAIQQVPEPSSLVLSAAGATVLLAVACVKARRSTRQDGQRD